MVAGAQVVSRLAWCDDMELGRVLHAAAAVGDVAGLRSLAAQGVDLNVQFSPFLETALHRALPATFSTTRSLMGTAVEPLPPQRARATYLTCAPRHTSTSTVVCSACRTRRSAEERAEVVGRTH